MDFLVSAILFIIGIIIIVKGSDWFVSSAVWFAQVLGLPQIVIGATVVSVCTTLPEALVAVTSTLQGETSMAIGNVLGSIATNSGLIMAVLFLFSNPKIENRMRYLENVLLLILCSGFVWFAGIFRGRVSSIGAILLLIILVLFLLRNTLATKTAPATVTKPAYPVLHYTKEAAVFLIGITLVIVGAHLVVKEGISIAEALGLPTILIAIVFTSLGTSLPELVTVLSAIRKNASSLGIGNIIGANVLNLTLALGASGMIAPISLTQDRSILLFQLPIILLMCFLLAFPGKHKFTGLLLFLLYFIFLIANILRETTPFFGNLF